MCARPAIGFSIVPPRDETAMNCGFRFLGRISAMQSVAESFDPGTIKIDSCGLQWEDFVHFLIVFKPLDEK